VGDIAAAEVSLPDGRECAAVSVHAPAAVAPSKHRGGRRDLARSPNGPMWNDVIRAELTDALQGPFLVGGDWNTGRKQGSAKSDAAGAAFFDRASAVGWSECVDPERRGQQRTWFGPGGIVQDDHVFADAPLAESARKVWVATEAVEDST
jgi:hypothetical protein